MKGYPSTAALDVVIYLMAFGVVDGNNKIPNRALSSNISTTSILMFSVSH